MPEMLTDEQLVEKIEELIDAFRSEFVDHLEGVEQTAKTCLLRIYEVWRHVSLRRTVDLSDAAKQMFQQRRIVPGCSLSRAVFESVGIQYYIRKKLIEYTDKAEPESIHRLLLSAVFGRKDKSWPERPIQVLTAIDHTDNEFRGFRKEYDRLCEYAHPNLGGGFGTYARQEGERFEVYFGTNPQGLSMGSWGLGSLHLVLTIATEINRRLCHFHADFVAMAEKHVPNIPN